jgi:predicted phage terminase large subunit-like protein
MRSDSKASGRWDTDAGGEYYAAGIGGAISGRGANLLIIDDPHSEQDAMSATALDAAYDWYISGPRQRLQPGGAIVLVMTRWGNRDLTSRLLKDQSNEKADQWEVVEFPAIFPETNNPLWPEFWNLEELEKVKASLTVSAWSAQWMQNPSAEESAILKREYWRIWEKKKPPECNYILQSYDTAFSKKAKADYSACTTWGVFTDQDEGQGIILLDSWKERLDFPELKKRAYDEYNYWNPDMILIEAKAAGTPLTHELRKIGLPVSNFTPSRGNDKITRAHGAAAVFESGLVWAPEDRFAQELIEECAAFPAGDSDDLVDSATQAILRFRQGGFIRSETDYELESSAWREPRSYY